MDKIESPIRCEQNHRIAQGQCTKTEQYENYVKSGGYLSFGEFYAAKYSSQNNSNEKSVNRTEIRK